MKVLILVTFTIIKHKMFCFCDFVAYSAKQKTTKSILHVLLIFVILFTLFSFASIYVFQNTSFHKSNKARPFKIHHNTLTEHARMISTL